MKKQGFTLIELLAVIVILGIVMAIAIPGINMVINNTKKNSFAREAQLFVSAARNKVRAEEVKVPNNPSEVTIISLNALEMDKGGKTSSFNSPWNYNRSYVLIHNEGTSGEPKLVYYIALEDEADNGINLTNIEGNLELVDGETSITNIGYEYLPGSPSGTTSTGTFTFYPLTGITTAHVYLGAYTGETGGSLPLATDSDFSGTANGNFRYIGTERELEIPHVIKGVPVTSYANLFNSDQGKLVTKVVSTNNGVIIMNNMFHGSQATTLDLSSFDTSSASDMSYMFYVSQTTTLDLSNFNTSNVAAMNGMFQSSKATTLDLSSFDTSSVTNMASMFYHSLATTLDLSSFDTSSVTNMGSMFFGSQATTLDLSSFDTSSVTYIASMFRNSQATTLDLSSFNTSKVTGMSDMFYGSRATTLDLSSFDTSKVTNMSNMFRDSQATTLDLSSFDTSNVTNMNYMFRFSAATIGYARTQADADKFNASSGKPAALTFIVKP